MGLPEASPSQRLDRGRFALYPHDAIVRRVSDLETPTLSVSPRSVRQGVLSDRGRYS